MTLPDRVCSSCATPIPGELRTCPSCGAISLPGVSVALGEVVEGRLRTALGHRYRIERELGEGGMAVVFLAHDLKHDRPVAVKVLRPELAAFLGAERFLREIHIAAQLNHPHIIPLHDSGDADGLLFYVMPYVEGDSVRQRLVRQGPLPIDEAVTIASEVADGLAYAHELGVVHRDIKPENILRSHGHAAIADFGIARAVAGVGTTITTAGMSLGTPTYMSPEQAAGDPALDHRTDIYSLGCVLYEMLTGRPPYPGPTPQALLAQHATEPVPEPRVVRRDVPAQLDAAVRRAMAKSAADRFQGAAEFRAALVGLAAAPGSAAPRLPSTARRRRALTSGATLAVVVGVVVLFLGHGPGPTQPATRPPLRVVVRPFEDKTGRQGPTAERITEALTSRLQPVPALTVVAASVAAELRGAPLDSLRARFTPDRFVIGRVEEAGEGLRVAAEIVDPRTDKALADSSVLVPRGGDVVGAAVEPLSVFVRHTFWADVERADRRARVHDVAAWDLVERARERAGDAEMAILERLDQQGFRALDVADSLLREARRRDAGSDLIPIDQVRLAERRGFYVEALSQVFPSLPAGLPRPAALYLRALADLDQLMRNRRASAEAFELRGRIKEGLYRQLGSDSLREGAVADYRAATELDRHRATAWRDLGSAYLTAGLYPDALLAIQHAFDEDAFQLYRRELLRSRFDAALRSERFDVAAEACRTGVAEVPRDWLFRTCEVELWSRTSTDRRSAAAARARVDSLAAGESGTLLGALRELWVADILARAGLGDSADHIARRATANQPAGWQPLLLLESAYLRMLRRDTDSALVLIAEAARRDPTTRPYIRAAPAFRPLRADPRFATAAAGNRPPYRPRASGP